jgi:predicted DNA-binding transcriptional regulator AlpA
MKGAGVILDRSRSWIIRAAREQVNGFPRPFVIGGKNCFRIADLVAWVEKQARREYSGVPAVEQE